MNIWMLGDVTAASSSSKLHKIFCSASEMYIFSARGSALIFVFYVTSHQIFSLKHSLCLYFLLWNLRVSSLSFAAQMHVLVRVTWVCVVYAGCQILTHYFDYTTNWTHDIRYIDWTGYQWPVQQVHAQGGGSEKKPCPTITHTHTHFILT